MRIRLAAVTSVVAVALVAGCSGDGTTPDTAEVTGTESATTETPAATDDASPSPEATDDAGSTDAASPSPTPAGGCEPVEVGADGRLDLGEVGSVTVTQEGQLLTLGEVQTAEGWEYEVTDADPSDGEVEVEFRNGGQERDLEVELQGGQLRAEICDDDD